MNTSAKTKHKKKLSADRGIWMVPILVLKMNIFKDEILNAGKLLLLQTLLIY